MPIVGHVRSFFWIGLIFLLWIGFFQVGSDFRSKPWLAPDMWIVVGQNLWLVPARRIGQVGSGRDGQIEWPMLRSSSYRCFTIYLSLDSVKSMSNNDVFTHFYAFGHTRTM
jgi:hypothetical protein